MPRAAPPSSQATIRLETSRSHPVGRAGDRLGDVGRLKKSAARGHPGLNRGPLDLQSNALPLSYTPSVREGHAAPRPVEGPRQSVPQNTSDNYVA